MLGEKAPTRHFPAASETSRTIGGAMTSGWISWARLKRAASEIIGVLVIPVGYQNVDGDAGAVEVLRHDSAVRLEERSFE